MVCSLAEGKRMRIPCPDSLGNVCFRNGSVVTMQEALDLAYTALSTKYEDQRKLWDMSAVKRWGKAPATGKQLDMIRRRCKDFDSSALTKGQASQIINRLMAGRR